LKPPFIFFDIVFGNEYLISLQLIFIYGLDNPVTCPSHLNEWSSFRKYLGYDR